MDKYDWRLSSVNREAAKERSRSIGQAPKTLPICAASANQSRPVIGSLNSHTEMRLFLTKSTREQRPNSGVSRRFDLAFTDAYNPNYRVYES